MMRDYAELEAECAALEKGKRGSANLRGSLLRKPFRLYSPRAGILLVRIMYIMSYKTKDQLSISGVRSSRRAACPAAATGVRD